MGSEGTDEGVVQAELVPCTSSGLYDTRTHNHTHSITILNKLIDHLSLLTAPWVKMTF